MSGSVSISEEHGWCKSGWEFRAILREVILELRTVDAPPDMIAFLEDPDGVPQVVDHIELPKLPQAWQRLFASAASTAYQRVRCGGFSGPMPDTKTPIILASWRELVKEMREIYELPSEFA
jgi:hypothetical protein